MAHLVSELVATPVASGDLVDRFLHEQPRLGYLDSARVESVAAVWPDEPVRMTASAWVDRAEGLVDGARSPVMNIQLLVLVLALLDPPSARAMLRSGLIAVLLDRYEPVLGEGLAALSGVLEPEAAERARSVPLLATAYGLDRPLVVSSELGGPTMATGLGWDDRGRLLIATADGTVRRSDGAAVASGLSAPSNVDADDEGLLVVDERSVVRASWDGEVTATTPRKGNVARQWLSGISITVSGSEHGGADAALTVQPPDGQAWSLYPARAFTDVSKAGLLRSWGVNQDGSVVVTYHGHGVVGWHDQRAGAAVGGGLGDGVLGSVSADGSRAVLQDSDRIDLLGSPLHDDVGRSGNLAVLYRSDPENVVKKVALSHDGGRLAVLLRGADTRVEVHDVRLFSTRGRASFVSDRHAGPDATGVTADIEAFAMLLASRSLTPPVCLGLFGDWGAGKTYFMDQLGDRIEVLSRTARESGQPQAEVEYWKHVRLVRFNAWATAEDDLWPSLMHTLFADLGTKRATTADSTNTAAVVGAGLLNEDVVRAEKEQKRRDKELAASRGRVLRARLIAATLGVLTLVGLVAFVIWIATDGMAAGLAAIVALLTPVFALGKTAFDLTRTNVEPRVARWWQAESTLRESQSAATQAAATVRALHDAAADPYDTVTVYIDQRVGRDEYRRHVGLVAQVQEDLRGIDATISAANAAVIATPEREATGGEQVNRLVVLVDDLDRCPPARVVGVLEAVSLLLAYPMLAVVLAVDTRWVQQALRSHHRRLLGGARRGAPTPLDYVEKIIQLPYQVRPMTPTQVAAMLRSLTADSTFALTDAATPAVVASPPPPAIGRAATRTTPVAPAVAPRAAPASGRANRRTPADLQPEGLLISPTESAFLARLAPLVGDTPRTVKRFVNSYRVIKARVPDPDAFATLVQDGFAEYEAAGLLLAVAVGLDTAAPDVFHLLEAARPTDSLGAVLGGHQVAETSRPALRSEAGAGEYALLVRWAGNDPSHAYEVAPLQELAPVAARFSFMTITASGGRS